MKCDECNGNNFSYDDRMGETVCDDCGYVQVRNIFEDKTNRTIDYEQLKAGNFTYKNEIDRPGELGSLIGNDNNNSLSRQLRRTNKKFRNSSHETSIQKGLLECNMVMSPFLPNHGLKDRVHSYYRTLYLDHKLRGVTLPLRACALVVICLRENGVPITITEIAEQNNEDAHKVSKYARHFARHLGKSNILQNMPINPWVDRICSDLDASVEFTSETKMVVNYIHDYLTLRDIHFTRSHMASAVWIASMLRKIGKVEHTQQAICDACKCTAVAQRLTTKKLYPMFNIDKDKLLTLDVEGFCAGIR